MMYGRKIIAHRIRVPAYSLVLASAALALVGCAKTDGSGTTDSTAASSTQTTTQSASTTACASDNGGITLPSGFCATVFADTIGHARHIVVNSNGDVYVNTWSGPYYQGPTHPGGFLVALRAADSRRDLALRRQQDQPEILTIGALRDRHP